MTGVSVGVGVGEGVGVGVGVFVGVGVGVFVLVGVGVGVLSQPHVFPLAKTICQLSTRCPSKSLLLPSG